MPSTLPGLRPPTKLEQQILNTYLFLRVGIAGLAIAFPWILALGGYFSSAHVPLQASMSDYYHAGDAIMRDWFVGTLWAVGAFLALYQGYSPLENVLLDAAGILVLGVALLPNNVEPRVHGFCAVGFFICIAAVCLFCAKETVGLLEDDDKETSYLRKYRVIGAGMILSIVTVLILRAWLPQYKFFAEFFGVNFFAAYWFVKSKEISETQADRRALLGEVERVDGKMRRVPVVR